MYLRDRVGALLQVLGVGEGERASEWTGDWGGVESEHGEQHSVSSYVVTQGLQILLLGVAVSCMEGT